MVEAAFVQQIQQAYPELNITSVRLLPHYGQFSEVLVINEALIFRFPRTPHVAKDMASEVLLLRQLQGRLPLPIPNPVYEAWQPETGELIFMGYPMLPGEPLWRETMSAIQDEVVLDQLADQLAGFLRVLHAIPLDSLENLAPVGETPAYWQELYTAFREKLYPYIRVDAQAAISANFEAFLADAELQAFVPQLRHGDFGTGNILYDAKTQRISGIIDFSFAGPGDVAQDVGALGGYGETFLERCFRVYPEMRHTLKRVEFIRSTYALQQALYALRDGDQAEFEDGIADYI
ncbi:MAG: phosphotransferase [Anaerolineae bacterium]|nr:phosphotransferase [Anaerolineae bacterium]